MAQSEGLCRDQLIHGILLSIRVRQSVRRQSAQEDGVDGPLILSEWINPEKSASYLGIGAHFCL